MRIPTLIALAVSLGLIVMALVTTPVCAAPRSTPVEVINPLALDPTSNTVKAEQLGTWSFFLTGTAAVTQSGSWNVGITGTPNVNVANTPNVSVTNSPTVKIDSATNTVKTPTQSNTIQLWTNDQVVAPYVSLYSNSFSCAGFKELRLMVMSTSNNTSSQVTVRVRFKAPTGYGVIAGMADFGYPGEPLTTHANFASIPGQVALTVPVMSDIAEVIVNNGTTSSVTIHNHSWVYLVN